jgi:hypothetical protein
MDFNVLKIDLGCSFFLPRKELTFSCYLLTLKRTLREREREREREQFK